jgi:hypothetical protein
MNGEIKEIRFNYQIDHYTVKIDGIDYSIEIWHIDKKIRKIKISSPIESAELSKRALKAICIFFVPDNEIINVFP